MHAAGTRVDELGQCIDVGGKKFFQGTMCQNFLDDGVLVAQGFEHLFGGGILSRLGFACLVRDFEFFEEHGADLFRRGDGKLVPGQCVDFPLERVQSGAEVVAGLAKCFGVEAHAVLFHAGEDGQQGHFDLRKHGGHVALHHLFAEQGVEAQRDVGIFARIVADVGRRQVAHVFLVATRADEFLDVDGAVVEQRLGKVVHVVALFGFHDVVRQHGVKKFAFHFHAVVRKHGEIVFQVLPHLDLYFVFEEGAEGIDVLLCFVSICRHSHIPSPVSLDGEAHSHQFGAHGLDICGFCVE